MTSPTEQTIHDQYGYWERAPLPQAAATPDAALAVIGCGTSYNLALSIAAASNAAGIRAVAVPGNEWLRRPQNYVPDWRGATVVALSRSGESTETVAAARRSRDEGLPVVAVTCEAQSSLARLGTSVLYAQTDPAEGIVMTTSASLMLLMGLRHVGATLDVGAAVAAARRLAAAVDGEARALTQDVRHVVYLGAGAAYGVAVEGGLKLQEMSQVFTQAYHPLEYRHGPISLVDTGTLVVMLYGTETPEEEAALVRDVQARGARVLGIGGPGDISLTLGETGATRLLATLPALQLLGERMANARALDTSAPRHLTKIVRIAESA